MLGKHLVYKNSFTEDTVRLLDIISRGPKTIFDKKIKAIANSWVHSYYDLLDLFKEESKAYQSFIHLSNSVNNVRLIKKEWLRNLRVILKEYQSLSLKDRKRDKKFSKNDNFIDSNRLRGLKKISSANFDLSRLLRMCGELNDNFLRKNYISSILLIRAILDHIPPIFGFKTFFEVTNNSKCEKSIKDSFQHLESSSRKIADGYLHIPIRKKETLPTYTQVKFTQDLDVLLGEIIRILKA